MLTENSVPNSMDRRDSSIPFGLKIIRCSEKPKIGVISGATTIPPIITAVLSSISPNDTIADESVIRTKKFLEGLLYSFNLFSVFLLSLLIGESNFV